MTREDKPTNNFSSDVVLKEISTSDELGQFLGISQGTLAKWRKMGLKYLKVSRTVLYRSEDVKSFLNSFVHCDYTRN